MSDEYPRFEGDRAYYKVDRFIELPSDGNRESSYLAIIGDIQIRIDPPLAVNCPTAKGIALRDEGIPGMFGGPKDRINSVWVPVMY